VFVIQKRLLSPFNPRFRICVRGVPKSPCVYECTNTTDLNAGLLTLQQLYLAEVQRVGCWTLSEAHLLEYLTRQLRQLTDSPSSSSASLGSFGSYTSFAAIIRETKRYAQLSLGDKYDYDNLVIAAVACDLILARDVLLQHAAAMSASSGAVVAAGSSPSSPRMLPVAQLVACRNADDVPLLLVAGRAIAELREPAAIVNAFEFVLFLVNLGVDINSRSGGGNHILLQATGKGSDDMLRLVWRVACLRSMTTSARFCFISLKNHP
jgi:hypothetical protein